MRGQNVFVHAQGLKTVNEWIKESLSVSRMVPYFFPHRSIPLLSLLGNAEAVYVLIQTGANIFSIDKEDRTVLYWAAMQDHKNVIDVRNL